MKSPGGGAKGYVAWIGFGEEGLQLLWNKIQAVCMACWLMTSISVLLLIIYLRIIDNIVIIVKDKITIKLYA